MQTVFVFSAVLQCFLLCCICEQGGAVRAAGCIQVNGGLAEGADLFVRCFGRSYRFFIVCIDLADDHEDHEGHDQKIKDFR